MVTALKRFTLLAGQGTWSAVAVEWPQTVATASIQVDRFLIANGTWPSGRWALVYDLKDRAVKAFLDRLEDADDFAKLTISRDGKILIQSNKNGRLFIYDVKAGKRLLSGFTFDDELVLYTDNGHYAATPEGAHFVSLKFPGVPGTYTFHQFEKKLKVPNLVERAPRRRDAGAC